MPAAAFRAGVCPHCALAVEVNAVEPELEPGAVPGYRLREKIGEGGMGEVFLAEQVKPVPREVALKRLKHTADNKWLARFEHELEALALLEHRGVATVFDAGVAKDGRPFYTMELVDGLPLTLFCDRGRLGCAHRLRLMKLVCDAVDYAHRRGVWHGDLKPSNMLVATSADGEPELKLIDFGVRRASLTGGDGARPPAMFTPGYASPESSASGAWDSRSDIYSLGVVLAELLGGKPPGIAGSVSEWVAAAQAGDIAAARATTPRRLLKLLRDDVDWIVAWATEAEPGARYGSAADMAADVTAVLFGYPVRAHPRSARYALGKWFRRRRRSIVLLSSAALIALAGTVGTIMHRTSARRAQVELGRTQAAAQRAMNQTAMMQELVRGIAMLTRAPNRAMQEAGLSEVLRQATHLSERAAAECDPAGAVALLAASASAAGVLERHDLAIEHWRRSLAWLDKSPHDLQRTGIEGALARSLIAAGDHAEAITLLTGIATSERLASLPLPPRLDVLTDLARAHFAARDFAAAARWAQQAVTAAGGEPDPNSPSVLHAVLLLGQAHTELRNYKEARTVLARAAQGLPPDSPPGRQAAQWLAEVEKVLRDAEQKD